METRVWVRISYNYWPFNTLPHEILHYNIRLHDTFPDNELLVEYTILNCTILDNMLYSVCASAAVDVFGRLVCGELQEAIAISSRSG